MRHHREEAIIQLILILDLFEVLLEDSLLEFDLLVAYDHLVGLRQSLHAVEELAEVVRLDQRIVDHATARTCSLWGGCRRQDRLAHGFLFGRGLQVSHSVRFLR